MRISDPYVGFSKVFDKVVSDKKYDKWEIWIKQVWEKFDFSPQSLLDLACWTWKNSIRFSKYCQVVWIDSSKFMIEQAAKNYTNIDFLLWHFLNFTLSYKVDCAICLDFSTNYILRSSEFIDFLNRVYDNLNDWWMFIFDFKPTKSFVKKERHLQESDFEYKWVCNSDYSPFVIIDITVDLKNWQITQERHIERWYELDEILDIIKSTKFTLLEIYDNCISKEIDENSDLVQLVLRK